MARSDELAGSDRERAEELYGAFLGGLETGGAGDGVVRERFRNLVNENQDLSEELERIHADLGKLDAVRRGALANEGLRDPALSKLLGGLAWRGSLPERFAILTAIGQGGQGRVHEAHDHSLGRRVAIKRPVEPSPGVAAAESTQTRLSRFVSEAQVTAQLDHPGVVAVHELGLDSDGRPFFSMARVRGRSLREIFTDPAATHARPSVVRFVGILSRVAETVAFAHARGVVHRDLKPENIMVGPFGEVYVMDWGLAHVDGTGDVSSVRAQVTEDASIPCSATPVDTASPLLTDPDGQLGTFAYLAPEARDDPDARSSPLVDVYALGAILHEILHGTPPAIASASSRRGGTPFAELDSIAERALAPDTDKRYPGASAMGDDLRAFLEGRVVAAHPTGAWRRLSKWALRHRALAALILTLVAGSFLFALTQMNSRRRLDRSADLYRLPYLEEQAEELWPEVPARLPSFDRWLTAAERLAGRLPLHARELRAMRARAATQAPVHESLQLELETLERTVERLEAFVEPDHGLLAEVRARRSWSARVEHETLELPVAEWRSSVSRITDPSGPYGLRMEPRVGLVPLGPDPLSGLEEFAFPRSGSVPARATGGELTISEETAIIFVLVPGGACLLGAQKEDAGAPGFDPSARREESPVHEIELATYWIAKHELTRSQWQHLGGGAAGLPREDLEGAIPGRHPIEGISYATALALLSHFGLTLPTEAQWAFAARAGTDGPFFGLDDPKELAGMVNLADRTVLDAELGWPQARGMEWLNDGFIRHAPVGSFKPNAFGLHDALGNVWEWCLDPPGSYESPVQSLTGLRLIEPNGRAVARGGGYTNNATFSRASLRDMARSINFDSTYHGLRPVLRQ